MKDSNMRNTFTTVTTFTSRGRTFKIFKDEMGCFWGIEDKYIVNGRFTKLFNGINGNMRYNIEDCLQAVRDRIEIDNLLSMGHTIEEAMKIYYIF